MHTMFINWKYIHNLNMKESLKLLSYPSIARERENCKGIMIGINNELWAYQAAAGNPQFQAINCTKCGEYKKAFTFHRKHLKDCSRIRCKCHN